MKKNYEKEENYRLIMAKRKRAFDSGFYLECILIEYALLEDRLLDVFVKIHLYRGKIGCYGVIKSNRKDLIDIGLITSNGKLNSIQKKIDLFSSLIKWSNHDIGGILSPFLTVVHASLKKANSKDDLINDEYFNRLVKWKNLRNEIIHNLMNKNPLEIEKEIRNAAFDGYELYKDINKFINRLNVMKIDDKIQAAIEKVHKKK